MLTQRFYAHFGPKHLGGGLKGGGGEGSRVGGGGGSEDITVTQY